MNTYFFVELRKDRTKYDVHLNGRTAECSAENATDKAFFEQEMLFVRYQCFNIRGICLA